MDIAKEYNDSGYEEVGGIDNILMAINRIDKTSFSSPVPSYLNITRGFSTTDGSYCFDNITAKEDILGRSLSNLWHSRRYLLEYVSFLLGSYSEEEFSLIAKDFARCYDNISDREIVNNAKVVLTVIKEDLTSSELGEILNIDPKDIDMAMQKTYK